MSKGEATLLIRIKQAGSDILDKVKSSMSAIGTAIVGFGVAAVASYREAEEASNALNQSMVQQGIFTSELRDEYQKMADAIQLTTTYSDDQATAAQAVLQNQLGSIAITKELMQATVDLAAAKKMDLASAAELVGKSIGTETNALARQGIQIDSSASKTERLAQVTEALNSKFGGQAAAAAQGLGSLSTLKNVLDDVFETVGSRLAPLITFFTRQLISFSSSLKDNSDFVNGLDTAIMFAAKTFLIFKEVIVGMVARVSADLGVLSEVLAQAFTGNFSKAKDAYTKGMDDVEALMIERKAAFDADFIAIENANDVAKEERRQKELQMESDALTRKKEIHQQANDSIFTAEQLKNAKLLGLKLKEKSDLDALDKAMIAAKRDTFNTIATLQGSHNKVLAIAGKAAAITSIALDTPPAVAKAYTLGPIAGPIAAGAVYAAMAAQAAKVMGVQLADGGIVRATPGGTLATIGEGGRDEAVIPLENGQIPGGGGGGSTIIFNGPILGDEAQAMEFARAIDKNLLKLRQSNQSVAFETDIF